MKIIEKIKNIGADNAAVIDVADIPFEVSLLDLCKMNTCGNYGKSWTCPPLSGEIEGLIEQAKQYKKMLVFQAVYKLEDSFDIEGMFEANENFRALTEVVADICDDEFSEFTILSAGGCKICETCAAVTNELCRAPERAYVPLEGYGIFVSKLAEISGIKYINGVNTVTYFGGVFF